MVDGRIKTVNNPSVTTNQVANPKQDVVNANNEKIKQLVEQEKEWSKKKINDTILQETINGEGEPVVGTEAIYYLTKFKKDGILNGNYGRVCGKYAQLNKINDDTYQHEQMSGSNSSEKVTISDIKKELQE